MHKPHIFRYSHLLCCSSSATVLLQTLAEAAENTNEELAWVQELFVWRSDGNNSWLCQRDRFFCSNGS